MDKGDWSGPRFPGERSLIPALLVVAVVIRIRNAGPTDKGGLNPLAWETGTGPVALIHGLEASLKLLNEVGVSRIQAYLETLTDHLCEQLRNMDYQVVSSRLAGEKSQIVCIRNSAGLSSMDLFAHLKKKNIITAPRGDRLRISPHFYNTIEEIDELVNALP